MFKFISLSSGSCGNCYYLNYNGFGLLIDLGIGIRSFKKLFSDYGLTIAQINAILVTHDHTDHVKAVGALSRDFRIPVYTSERVHESIQRNHFVSKKIPLNLQHSITRGEAFNLGPFSITSFGVPHDSADNNGYIICTPEEHRFVLLTDVGHFTDEMPAIIASATHLVIESNYSTAMLQAGRYPQRLKNRISSDNGHISNEATAQFLATHLTPGRIKRVWLCHLSAENNRPSVAYEVCSQALTQAGYQLEGTPSALEDGNEHPTLKLEVLPRRTPTLVMEL